MSKRFFSGNMKKIYTLGIFLICGLLFISADDCESMYLEELKMAQASGGQGSTAPAAAAKPAKTTKSAASSAPAATAAPATSGTPGSTEPAAGSQVQAAFPEGSQVPASTGAEYLKTIIGKDWKLAGLRLSDKSVVLDRNKLSNDGAGDFFTMTIDNSRLSGKAAPNRYMTAYQAGADNSLTLQPVISTLMATSYDPERLQEQEYYQYLGRVKSWKLNQKTLELNTVDANNKDAVLIYN